MLSEKESAGAKESSEQPATSTKVQPEGVISPKVQTETHAKLSFVILSKEKNPEQFQFCSTRSPSSNEKRNRGDPKPGVPTSIPQNIVTIKPNSKTPRDLPQGVFFHTKSHFYYFPTAQKYPEPLPLQKSRPWAKTLRRKAHDTTPRGKQLRRSSKPSASVIIRRTLS
jgi:hypothetical protein